MGGRGEAKCESWLRLTHSDCGSLQVVTGGACLSTSACCCHLTLLHPSAQ
jgi:hypothetical protein